MPVERTFAMIKPDAVARGLVGEILARFEAKGLRIMALKFVQVPRSLAEKHYAVHKDKPFYGGLVEFITSGPVVPMVLEGESAIKTCRALMGATNPVEGRPGESRFDHAQEIGRNIIHGSDGPETAEFEIGLWFSKDELVEWRSAHDPHLFEE